MKKVSAIRLIAFDVDGTLTPGNLIFGPDGEAYKEFSAKDGLGITLARRLGFQTGLITGRSSAIVEKRAAELHMDFVLMGISDKVAAMDEVLRERNLSWDALAYMGDDLNDLALMKSAGFSGSPADGAKPVRKAADFVTAHKGGRGAARDFIEEILKRQGRQKEALALYLADSEGVTQ